MHSAVPGIGDAATMRVAIVSLEFANAQRTRSLAQALAARGHRVAFYTSEPDSHATQYEVNSIPFTRATARVRSAAGLSADANLARVARERGRSAERAVSLAARTFETLAQFPDKYRAWIPAVRAWLRADPHALDGTDVIVASTPPPSALFIGRMFAEVSGATLVYDFRDLWTDNPSYPYGAARRTIDRITERSVMRAPHAALTATKSLADALSARNPGLPIRAVYTGVDPAPWVDLPARQPDGHLVFGHFGVWYPRKRSLRSLLESLRRLADAGVIQLDRVSIQLWGNGTDAETREATRDLGMVRVVEDRGWLEQRDVPAALARVDVALLLAWPEDTTSVPLKTHGYVASGKPILVLGANAESEMASVLRGLTGVTLAPTPEDIDAAVLEYWHAASTGQPVRWTLDERPLPATQESMATGLFEVLRSAGGLPYSPSGSISS
jgi:hypothetical protein